VVSAVHAAEVAGPMQGDRRGRWISHRSYGGLHHVTSLPPTSDDSK